MSDKPTDTELLDWLQGQMRPQDEGWLCRLRAAGSQFMLRTTTNLRCLEGAEVYAGGPDIRTAIVAAMEKHHENTDRYGNAGLV